MRLAFLTLTTACLGCAAAALYKISRARRSARVRSSGVPGRSPRGRGRLALFLSDPDYRHEWFAELSNVYRRMEILRRRKLLRHCMFLTSGEEQIRLSPERARLFERARIRSIQSLKTIHPGATVVDLYLVGTVIGPDLFEEDWDKAEVSARGRIRTG